MPLVGIIVETPSLVRVGLPIFTLAEFEINRELNAVSSWSLAFTCAEPLSAVIKSRYRISIVEEGRSGYLLRRGIITARTFRVSGDASGVLALQGFSRTYVLNGQSTHVGLEYDGTESVEAIAEDLLGESVIVPSGITTRMPKIIFNDTSKLQALYGAAEYARVNVRETWDGDIELVKMDDVPDSGYKFVLARNAGSDRASAAARGLGLISGSPSIGHDGVKLATRIIPSGMNFDGTQLTLAYSDRTAPFPIQSAMNPDGSTYYYIEIDDPDEIIEEQMVRSDVKCNNNDAGQMLLAANVVYDLAAAKLLYAQNETISFAAEIANGNQIDALPGSRVQVQFEGQAITPWKTVAWESLDRHMLITKRRDVGFAGTRRVAFTVVCPEVSIAIPDLPEAVPIPTPNDSPDPPDMEPDDNWDENQGGEEPEDIVPETPRDLPPSDYLNDVIEDMKLGRGKLQPCCADITTTIPQGATPVPPL